MKKTPKTPTEFYCENCNFKCSNKKDYSRHLSTAKHINRTKMGKVEQYSNEKPRVSFDCVCGKKYSARNSLWYHKQKCKIKQESNTDIHRTHLINSVVSPENDDHRNELIEKLFTSNTEMVNSNAEIINSSNEMKSMFQLLLEKYQESQLQYQESQLQNQELMSKMIDVMPQMGNTTNNNSHNTTNNNTLNFYLTNTCKDAESIHDFTERFVKRSVDFFKGNYLDVAHNQIDLASNVYDIFKNCLDENPQTKKFVQTTDVKNGVLYIKEKQKDENKQLCGEAEFIKHMDGFEKAGTNISHAINCAFIPVQDNYKEIMERDCGKEPNEDDYEDEDHYERDMDIYKEKTGDLKRHLLVQSFNAVCLFDAKKRRNEVLEKTRRLKE